MAAVRGGSNTLRGGKNQYGAKTLNDNWVEDRYDPVFGGTTVTAATTSGQQDLEGVLRLPGWLWGPTAGSGWHAISQCVSCLCACVLDRLLDRLPWR